MTKYRVETKLINLSNGGKAGVHTVEFDTDIDRRGIVVDKLRSIPVVVLRTICNRDGLTNPDDHPIPHDSRENWTMAVPEAGRKYFGIGKNASYIAAKNGEIPTIRVGGLLRVPVAAMERRLEEA